MASRYTYLKQPGILYDMMFALKLRFNGERAYTAYRKGCTTYEEDSIFYQNIIRSLQGISNKLLPFFYWQEEPHIPTTLPAYMREHFAEYRYTEDVLIDDFYNSLRDVQQLKKFLYKNYFSSECPDVIDLTSFEPIKNTIYEAALPDDVKMYLIDFMLYGEKEIERIICELKKVQAVCEEMYQINSEQINTLTAKFDAAKAAALSSIFVWNISKYEHVYYTYSVVFLHSLSGTEYHETDWISFLGIKSEDRIYKEIPEVKIDLFELGRILYEEVRLKILGLLLEKPMYCAQIARALELKNNSTLYHLNMMERQQLIQPTLAGKKIYYQINHNYLKSVIKYIENTILNYKGGAN